MAAPKKVTIVGSGNWGSAIARIVGLNTKVHNGVFDEKVLIWVYEEVLDDGRKLSEVINAEHENVKYLPGKKIPANVFAETDLVTSCKEADILIFVVPHQHVTRICSQLKGNLKQGVIAISLIKGLSGNSSHGLRLISEDIHDSLGAKVAVLMGANLAPEVANDSFCEATIGSEDSEIGPLLKKLFHTDNFRISVVKDAKTVELCGALKNVVACAAGFSDGLGFGDNTKAAIIRLGLMEMVKYIQHFYPGSNIQTFFESCGVADMITTCYGGRNRKVCEAFVKTKKSLKDVEAELLNGQSAQGPLTAEELYQSLKDQKLVEKFPLFVAVHRICQGELPAEKFIDLIRDHPEYNDK